MLKQHGYRHMVSIIVKCAIPMLNYRHPGTQLLSPLNNFAPLLLVYHFSKLNRHSSTSLHHATHDMFSIRVSKIILIVGAGQQWALL